MSRLRRVEALKLLTLQLLNVEREGQPPNSGWGKPIHDDCHEEQYERGETRHFCQNRR